MNNHRSLFILVSLTLAACSPFRDAMQGHQQAVARVDGYELTVEHAAQLLANGRPESIPTHPSTVDRLASLWIGYTILASELVSEDTFTNIDFAAANWFDFDQELVWKLWEAAIVAPSRLTDEQLREGYERDQPYARADALHILIRVPENASQAVADSLGALAERIRDRAAAGENFEDLARQYSDDPATASRGGRLGWIVRGQLLPELEAVAFALQPGEISETVSSRLGYHIVKVTDREVPDFAERSEEYREELMDRDAARLEEAFIDSLFAAADVKYRSDAISLVRQLAPSAQLERLGSARRALVLADYRGGKLTLGEWADFVVRGGQDMRRAFASPDSARVQFSLRELVRNELLIKAARDMGITLSEVEADSLASTARRALVGVAVLGRLRRIQIAAGDLTVSEAVDRIMLDFVRGQRSPNDIDRMAVALRYGRNTQVYPDRFPVVLERLAELREEAQQSSGREPPASETPAEQS
ncbi:MAG: peptidyl-prolyl cis-trans isomerase [Gemmatimonadota bacterium]|nr:MAG: peptidyl-prolyl cis-trans isomerase [Gemmatimonadota bacterium]